MANPVRPVIGIRILSTTGDIFSKNGHTTFDSTLLVVFVHVRVGWCILGHRVMEAIAEDLAKVTPSSGYDTEFGAALTLFIASNAITYTISTIHCIVGSVIFVGRFRSPSNVHWKIFANIISWLFTQQAAAGDTAFPMFGFMQVLR
jgi:solute carrier family 20 (sodium-dependent phosphate transporter)